MELPTYTNIWKIEKRLYKLYDFRLPMPLPIGQVAAFLAIAIPYMLILTMAGMPFSHTWVWLYVLPPGVLAWLVTRPVIEGKRLPELVVSQLRYLSEPRMWCRMAPLAEPDQIYVTAKVWRRSAVGAYPVPAAGEGVLARAAWVSAFGAELQADGQLPGDGELQAHAEVPGDSDSLVEAVLPAGGNLRAEAAATGPVRPVWPTRPAIGSHGSVTASRRGDDTRPEFAAPAPPRAVQEPPSEALRGRAAPAQTPPAQAPPAQASAVQASAVAAAPVQAPPAQTPPGQAPPGQPYPRGRPAGRAPAVTVRTDGAAGRPRPAVERVLRSSPLDRTDGWHERVVLVPGGHRPGKPDQLQRDQARARFPLPGPARIVVLGCTAGAGQTTTTLLTGQVLAALRGEAVAVLDIGSGPGSLTEQARLIPRLLPALRDRGATASASGRERGLQVVTADVTADEPGDAGELIDAVVARYRITIADPAAAHVPRAVHVADQLVLVAPASADAAGSLAMTLEWLEAHGHDDLARRAVIVLNGVSAPMAAHVDKAAGVAAGRCRAIVRVPWDDRLADRKALGTATVHAYTALGGVLVAGLADASGARGASTAAASTVTGRR